MKVLVVDDNKDLADFIQSVLEGEGMEVMSANDGIDGYADYLSFKPDLVITDIQMPGGTGFEMMRHIRTHKPMIKTVYMSGDIDAYRLASESGTSLPIDDGALLYHESLQQPADGLPSSH